MSSWCPGRAGSKSAAEELVRPSVRGFVGTIPGVLSVAEGTPRALKGWRTAITGASLSRSLRRGPVTPISTTRITARSRCERRGRRADRRLRHLTRPRSHLLARRTDQTPSRPTQPEPPAAAPVSRAAYGHRDGDPGQKFKFRNVDRRLRGLLDRAWRGRRPSSSRFTSSRTSCPRAPSRPAPPTAASADGSAQRTALNDLSPTVPAAAAPVWSFGRRAVRT